jgi:DNA polymerase-3 subunit alpha
LPWYFLKRKNPHKKLVDALPPLEMIVAATRGMLLFQEQIMWLAREIASFSWLESNRLRKDLGARLQATAAWGRKFVRQGMRNGYEKTVLEKLFRLMAEASPFCFSKASASACVDLALKLAYFKFHHPKDFHKIQDELELSNPSDPLVLDLTAFLPFCRKPFHHA